MESDSRSRGGAGAGSRLPIASPADSHWPPPVLPGETIALAAPASCVARESWEAGIRVLEEWGFRVKCGPEVFHSRALGGEADRLLARRFEEVWLDPEVKAV